MNPSSPIVALALIAGILATPRASADEFHLVSGIIEGRAVEEAHALLTIETESGLLQLPAAAVTRRIRGQTRTQRYHAVRDAEPLTPARHAELAAWCLDAAMPAQAQAHIAHALAEDPTQPQALTLSGYVKIDQLWVKLNPPAKPAAAPARAIPPEAIAATLSNEWHRRVSLLLDTLLARTTDQQTATRTREQLDAIRSPQAVTPLCKFLGAADAPGREMLVELLPTFESDEALLNLAVLALLDPERKVRSAAADRLAPAPGTRVREFFTIALRCENERLVRNAAQVLGTLDDRTAVSDLIDALNASAPTAKTVPVKQLFADLARIFAEPVHLPVGPQTVPLEPKVIVVDLPRTIERVSSENTSRLPAFRSEVQDALIAITGQNFGFDDTAWRDWLARNPPIGSGIP